MKSDSADPATPTAVRCVTSYPVRRKYRPGVIYPPAVPGVAGAIDLHCHAHEGQNDALALAKVASQSGMRGIVFKTIATISAGDYRPGLAVKQLNAALERWSVESDVQPAACWAGYGITMDNRPPSV